MAIRQHTRKTRNNQADNLAIARERWWNAVSDKAANQEDGPFSTRQEAERYATQHGWQCVRLSVVLFDDAHDSFRTEREDLYEVGGRLLLSEYPDAEFSSFDVPLEGAKVSTGYAEPRTGTRLGSDDPLADWKAQQLEAIPEAGKWKN